MDSSSLILHLVMHGHNKDDHLGQQQGPLYVMWGRVKGRGEWRKSLAVRKKILMRHNTMANGFNKVNNQDCDRQHMGSCQES
jgi:hypothetical protein